MLASIRETARRPEGRPGGSKEGPAAATRSNRYAPPHTRTPDTLAVAAAHAPCHRRLDAGRGRLGSSWVGPFTQPAVQAGLMTWAEDLGDHLHVDRSRSAGSPLAVQHLVLPFPTSPWLLVIASFLRTLTQYGCARCENGCIPSQAIPTSAELLRFQHPGLSHSSWSLAGPAREPALGGRGHSRRAEAGGRDRLHHGHRLRAGEAAGRR